MVDEVTYKNPIDRWFETEGVVNANGLDNCRKYAAAAKSKCPLDYKTDDPLPAWAVDLLRAPNVSYRGRIRILMAHANDIFEFHNPKGAK